MLVLTDSLARHRGAAQESRRSASDGSSAYAGEE